MYEEDKIKPDLMNRSKENPFKTPEHYFDSLEDRIMGRIEYSAKKKNPSLRIYHLFKPALGLVASFALVFLLVYYPINTFLLNKNAKTEIAGNTTPDSLDGYSFSFSLIDENSLLNTIFSDETTADTAINSDDVIAYLASGSSDVQIYADIQN